MNNLEELAELANKKPHMPFREWEDLAASFLHGVSQRSYAAALENDPVMAPFCERYGCDLQTQINKAAALATPTETKPTEER